MVTKEQIKSSMEYKWRLSQCKTYLVIWGVMLVFALIGGFGGAMKLNSVQDGLFISLVTAAILSTPLLPMAIYPMVQIARLMKRAQGCTIHRVMLDRPATSTMYRGAVYYTVEFTQDGERFLRDTKPLWSSAPMARFQLGEYNNKQIDILYDRESDQIIVLGK